MTKNKEDAVFDFVHMTLRSRTWSKMSRREQERFEKILEQPYSVAIIKGTYKQRWEACEALYHTFLEGLGYTPLDWGN